MPPLFGDSEVGITINVFTGSLKCYLASLILSASRGVDLHQNKIKEPLWAEVEIYELLSLSRVVSTS